MEDEGIQIRVAGSSTEKTPHVTVPVRYITIKLILTNGSFSESNGSNVKTFTCNSVYGHCNAQITITKKGMGFSGESASVIIHGLDMASIEDLQYMQQFSPTNLGINSMEIYAGNYLVDGSLPNFIYKGEVFEAKLPTNPASNDIGFIIKSLGGATDLNQYTQTTSIKGKMSHDSIIRGIISRASYGYNYLPNGVSGFASDVHLKGNWRKQLAKFCGSWGYVFRIDTNKIYVAPFGNALTKGQQTTISSNNIMQGNPEGANRSVIINTWYDSNIVYGQKITLDTYLKKYAGEYVIVGMTINIANNDDAWDCQLELARYYGK